MQSESKRMAYPATDSSNTPTADVAHIHPRNTARIHRFPFPVAVFDIHPMLRFRRMLCCTILDIKKTTSPCCYSNRSLNCGNMILGAIVHW
jgi:hypothetical protein